MPANMMQAQTNRPRSNSTLQMRGPAKIDIWHIPVQMSKCAPGRHQTLLLSEDERTCASKFIDVNAKALYISARTALRCILAKHLHCHPKDVPLKTSRFGKPYVDKTIPNQIFFNLSKAGCDIYIATSSSGPIGIDAEPRSRKIDPEEFLSANVLSSNERKTLETLEPSLKAAWCLRCWVAKEAYIKADGRGLTLDVSDLDFCSPSAEQSLTTFTKGISIREHVCKRRFRLVEFENLNNLVAVAYSGSSCQLNFSVMTI